MRSRSHDEAMAKFYREDMNFAVAKLNQLFEEGEPGDFSIVLRQLALALPDSVSTFDRQAVIDLTDESVQRGPLLADWLAVVRAFKLQMVAKLPAEQVVDHAQPASHAA